MVNIAMRSRHVWLAVVLSTASAACTNVLPTQVTCASVRGLQLGMSREAVEAAIGSPAKYAPAFQAGRAELGQGGEIWSYETRRGLGGVSFTLDFDASGLVRISIRARYVWESGSTRAIYEVRSTGIREQPEFAKIMNCSA